MDHILFWKLTATLLIPGLILTVLGDSLHVPRTIVAGLALVAAAFISAYIAILFLAWG
jgi:hypothetical protein